MNKYLTGVILATFATVLAGCKSEEAAPEAPAAAPAPAVEAPASQ